MTDSIEQCFVSGSRNFLTTDISDVSKPYVTRGITQRPEINHCIANKRDFYFIDTGYVGNFPSPGNPGGKKMYHRIVKNDIQHCELQEGFPSDRWKKLVKSDPRLEWRGWKDYQKKILLVMPNPKACRYYGIDYDTWMNDTEIKIKKQIDLPIEIRVKGSRSERNKGYTIYDAFDSGVYATVALNSIAALESVLYGIPAFVSVPCAATPLCNPVFDLHNPYKPEISKILNHCHRLAYGQFTVDEISKGVAFELLERKI